MKCIEDEIPFELPEPKMTQDNMNSILIALPPYEEQKRLEFQVNHILKTVSTIENEKEDIVNYIISAKSKILDLAIRGKLVPQELLVPIPPYKQQCQISATFDKSLFYFDTINALCE